jgi:hypothetical protein
MTNRSLTTYLNDHLAGSVVALELLEYLIAHSQGLNQEPLIHLRSEIEQDQKVLQTLLHDLGGKESPLRKAAGWLTEKLGQAKLKLDDSGEGDFRDLEAFEAVALGIQGKLSLWRALAAVGIPASTSIDLETLQARATDQFNQVERLRLLAAARAFGPHSDRKS